MWSTGIIMHMLLQNGNHPIYKQNDTTKTFIKRL